MDDYRYFLTVEWDQKDHVSFESKTKEFEMAVDELIEQGLTYADLGTVPAELKQLKLSDREVIKDQIFHQASSSKGASWNGEILAPAIILGITAIAVVAFIRYASKKNARFDECVELHSGDEQSCIDR